MITPSCVRDCDRTAETTARGAQRVRPDRRNRAGHPPNVNTLYIKDGREPSSPYLRYAVSMGKWCTVTVTDGEGKRYSLDVNADSSYDAAHLYLTHVRGHPSCGFPIPTTLTLFEVVRGG